MPKTPEYVSFQASQLMGQTFWDISLAGAKLKTIQSHSKSPAIEWAKQNNLPIDPLDECVWNK